MNGAVSVIIPDGECIFALSVLRCLARAGVRTHVSSADRWAPIRFSRYRDRFFGHDSALGEAARVDALELAARSSRADVLLPVGQRAIQLVATHRDRLQHSVAVAPVPSTAAFEVAADKWRLATFCFERGIPHPQTVAAEPAGLLGERLATIAFPALLKPARGSNGRGIRYFETTRDLVDRLASVPPKKPCIVQSYVPGHDIDCSALCFDGKIIAHTIQQSILPGYNRFGAAAGIDFLHHDAVLAAATQLLRELRWTGIAHIDLRFDPNTERVWVIEINPRYWGTLLGSLVAGVNFPHVACLMALGEEVPEQEFEHVRFIAGRAALRAIGRRALGRTGVSAALEDTGLGFILRDPLPEMLGRFRPFRVIHRSNARVRAPKAAVASMQ